MDPAVYRIKKTLEDIIDVAYADVPAYERVEYKRFAVKMVPKELATRHGQYNEKTKTITVNNLSREPKSIAKTFLHEMAHHIDTCKNGTSGHQAPFYEEYTKLIYASMDMGILAPEDFFSLDSQDSYKVLRIVHAWKPDKTRTYDPPDWTLKVRNGFNEKETLKQRGYSWNGFEKVWQKSVKEENLDREEEALKELGLTDFNATREDLFVRPMGEIVATWGPIYDRREALKAAGFQFDSHRKVWRKKVYLHEKKEVMEELKKMEALDCIGFR